MHFKAPNVLESHRQNVGVKDWIAWKEANIRILSRPDVEACRIHVAGDFMNDGKLDREYITHLLSSFREARKNNPKLKGWFYTHAWRYFDARDVHRFHRESIQAFASVHTLADAVLAKKKGFRAAYASETKKREVSGMIRDPQYDALPCLEQTGRKPDCLSCGYCFHDGKDLVLYKH